MPGNVAGNKFSKILKVSEFQGDGVLSFRNAEIMHMLVTAKE
jgi:hypothetical protein